MKDGSHKKKSNTCLEKFFSGEQQGEGHGVVQCVEGEYHQWCFFLSFLNQLIKIQART